MIQNNVMMVGLTISMHFQQFEGLKFQFFPRGEPLQSVQTVLFKFKWDCPKLSWFQSGHKFPDFGDQLSQANEQRNCHIFVKSCPIIMFVIRYPVEF